MNTPEEIRDRWFEDQAKAARELSGQAPSDLDRTLARRARVRAAGRFMDEVFQINRDRGLGARELPDEEYAALGRQLASIADDALRRRSCPDGGVCHHRCGDGPCFRVQQCGPSSAYGETWPVEVVEAEASKGEASWVL